MSKARTLLDRIVIAGDGQLGVLAAIALKRALPNASIIVVGLPPEAGAFADQSSTALPFTNRLHYRLGIDEEIIVTRAGGSHRLVTRYFSWGGNGQYGAVSYGAVSDPLQSVAFGREWGGGSRSGTGTSEAGSLAETLADAGRFQPPTPGRVSPLADIDYALRWNVPAYRALLIGMAKQLGIEHRQADEIEVEHDGEGGITSISLDQNSRVTAELYVDCTGPSGRLIGALPGYQRVDWSNILPTARLQVASAKGAMLALEDRFSLTPTGWLAELAGRDGLQVVLGTPEHANEEAILRELGAEPITVVSCDRGRVVEPWLGNVVAIGDASAQFEPLSYLNLDLAHRQLDLLLEMLPGQQIEPLERAEFNRRAGLMMDGACDMLSMHFAAASAKEVFRNSVPEHIETDLDQFTRRGRLPFREDTPLVPQETMSLLRALGFEQGVPPQLSGQNPRQLQTARDAFARKCQAVITSTPMYQGWMAKFMSAVAKR